MGIRRPPSRRASVLMNPARGIRTSFLKRNGQQIFSPNVVVLYLFLPLAEIAELIVGLGSVSVAGSRRERPTARRSRPEMARNGLKRLNPRPEMVWARKPRTHKIWYPGRATDRARLRLTNRKNDKLQKKAPKALKSLDAELKSAPVLAGRRGASSLRGASRIVGRPTLGGACHTREKRVDRTTGREIFLPARP